MMNMKKRVMSGVLGAALALTGFAGVTTPAMAVVGNGSYIKESHLGQRIQHSREQRIRPS